MPPEKYKTVAFDSVGELARLIFSWEMKKAGKDLETIRKPQNYPGMTERLNILVRRLKSFRDDKKVNVVLTAHEDIQRIYAKGGMIGKPGEPPPEPIAVRGWLDVPGTTAPQEVARAVDNIFRMRYLNGKPALIARPESIGPGAGDWEVKDRFGARDIQNGILPATYPEIKKLFEKHSNWSDFFIWVFYGSYGIGKTRLLATFPRPIKIFDIDKGTASIKDEILKGGIDVVSYNSEEKDDYERFIKDMELTYGQL